MRLLPALMILIAAMLGGCSQIQTSEREPYAKVAFPANSVRNLTDSCVAKFDPTIDYFPEKVSFRQSNQLSVTYHGHYKRLRFRPANSPAETVDILFVQCGTPVPDRTANSIVVQVPARRLATATRAMLGAADRMDMTNRFVGINDTRAITVASFKRRAESGDLTNMSGYAHGSIEPLLAVMPDVYFTFHSAYPQFNIHPRLWSMGVAALPFADGLEATPLGRAEWLKVLGLVTNSEARADRLFDEISERYAAVRRKTAIGSQRPLVLSGTASQRDVMELFGGANHRAALLADAGGRYVLADDRFPGSWLITSFERVYAAGAEADAWIGVRPGIASIDALIAANPHHRWFRKAIETRNVYSQDQGYSGLFAYHLEDQGLDNPDILLSEIAVAIGSMPPSERPEPAKFLRKLP